MNLNINHTWKNLDSYTKKAFYIILIGTVIRFALASINHVTGDPCWYISLVRAASTGSDFPLFGIFSAGTFWPPPLLEIIGVIFYKSFLLISHGFAEFSLRLISPLSGALMLVYSFFIAKKLFSTKIAFYSVLFLAFIPNHIYQSSMFFPDILVGLFIIMGIYYSLNNNFLLSGVIIGLSFLTKYNALFAFPVPFMILLFNFMKEKLKPSKIIARLSAYSLISFVIGSFWFIRNYIFFGNPVYPLFNSVFIRDAASSWGGKIYFVNLIEPQSYLKIYLSFFGVPDGYFQNLFFLNVPFLKLFLVVWFLGTVAFILPIIIGLFKIEPKKRSNLILALWLAPYLIFSFLTLTSMADARAFLSRYLIPIFPIIAILWAIGFNKLYSISNKKIKIFTTTMLVLVIIGFVSVEFVKSSVVKESWNFYENDFEWVKNNTPKSASILVPRGTCYSYNFNRPTYSYFEPSFEKDPIKGLKGCSPSYIWVNEEDILYGFEPGSPAVYSKEFTDYIEDTFELAYHNKQTKTRIYKTK